jgi:hypothetical protein
LTLYTIEQQKESDDKTKLILQMQMQYKKLEQRVSKLENYEITPYPNLLFFDFDWIFCTSNGVLFG